MQLEKRNKVSICVASPSSAEPYASLVNDICQVLREPGHEVWSFDVSESLVDEGLSLLRAADWLIIFLTQEQRASITNNPKVDKAIREKISGNAVMTLRLTDPNHVSAPIALAPIQWANLSDYLEHYPADRTAPEQVEAWQHWLSEQCGKLLERIDAGNNIEADIEELAKHLSPSDYVSKIVHKAEDFVGRDWLLDEINQWFEESNERLCLLEGPIGVGKSTLCAHLAEINPNVIGMHFCTADSSEEQATSAFIRTLAFQLAARIPDYRDWLLRQIREQGKFSAESLHHMTPVQLVNELIFNDFAPDLNIAVDARETLLVIVDGLDRTVYGDKTARNEGEPNLAELLAQEFPKKLPVNVRLLVTSRKVSGVSGLFEAKEIVFSPNDARQSADVEAYLRQAIAAQDNNDEPFESALGMAKQASGSSMLYASTLIRALASGEVSFPFHGIPNLKEVEVYYLNAMREMFGDNKWHQPYKGIAPIDVARELIAFNRPVPRAHFMSKFSLQRRDVGKVLGPLFFALLQDKDDSGDPTYVFFHDSFSRWLTNPNQPHAYQI